MKKLNQFNIVCEEKEIDLLFESNNGLLSYFSKKWSLENEFEAILPFIFNKVKLGFANMCGTNSPGELITAGLTPDITTFDEGSNTPGFQAAYFINDDYAKTKLLPSLLKNSKSPFVMLNKKYDFLSKQDLNIQLVIRVSANAQDEIDLSKPNVRVQKFSVKSWHGLVYLNFDIDGIDRSNSNVQIGTINTIVDVKEYKSLISRINDTLTKKDVQRDGIVDSIGNAINHIFNPKKVNDAKWDKIKAHGNGFSGIPGATIKCIVNYDNNLKSNITLDNPLYNPDFNEKFNGKWKARRNGVISKPELTKQTENNKQFEFVDVFTDIDEITKIMDIETFNKAVLVFKKDPNYEISYDIGDDDSWTLAKKAGTFYEPVDKKVNMNNIDANNLVCLYIYSNLAMTEKDCQKTYRIFINIQDWKKNNFKNKWLIEKNTIEPKINVLVYNVSGKEILSRWYTFTEFKKAEQRATEYILGKMLNMDPPQGFSHFNF